MIYKFYNMDETLMSFMCGIFSNIPITLLLTMVDYGSNDLQHAYFFVWLAAFVLSFAVTACAIAFTTKKVQCEKAIVNAPNPMVKLEQKRNLFEENKKFFRVVGWLFVLVSVILLLSIIALWVLHNYIQAVTIVN